MSQKSSTVGKNSEKVNKTSSKVTTSQSKVTKKSDEKNERKPNQISNKSVKTVVKPITTSSDKNKTIGMTSETKKKPEISKPLSKTVPKTLNTKTKPQNQSNVKPNDLKQKAVSVKNTSIKTIKKEEIPKKNVIQSNKNKVAIKKNEPSSNNKPLTKSNFAVVANNKSVINESIVQNGEKEDQINKDSSDEQYVSLATLESYSSYKKSDKSSESILAEPPSMCDTDIDEIINNTSDQLANDDFPSDYCDDFEEYESDFEDDEDQLEEQDEDMPAEEEPNEKEQDEEDEQSEHQQQENHYKSSQNYENNLTESHKNFKENNISLNNNENHLNDVKEENQISSKRPDHSYQSITESVKSAKIRSENESQRNKSIKRSKELLEIIKLDEMVFTNFDLPPINYELFIKTFGRKDSKQVSCQTSEREDIDTQTDSVPQTDKWTQNPSFSRLTSGNENQLNENNLSNDFEPKVNPFELIAFLNKSEAIMTAIIDIELENHSNNKRSLPRGAEQFSTSVSLIKCLPLAKKSPISLLFGNTLYLFCVQNFSKTNGSAEKSVISVWSLMSDKTEPIKVLICRSHIVRGFSHQNLVVGAMIDGSVALWDLNQQSLYDKEVDVENHRFLLRTPSYNCALTAKGHDFPIVDIKKLIDSELDDRFLRFGTIDETGVMIVWAVNENKDDSNDSPLSQLSSHRITRVSATNHLAKLNMGSDSVKITAFECQPNDWSNFYCGTDNGSVIRLTLIEESVNNLPKIYQKSYLNSFWTKVSVISFNDSDVNKFLVAFTDGFIAYYSIANENPLIIFNSNEMPIIDLKWISDNSGMSFLALNDFNQIFIWKVTEEQDFKPFIQYKHPNDRLLSMSLWEGSKTFLVFGCDSGQTLIFDFHIK